MSLISVLITFLFIGSSSAGWVLEDDYSTSNFFDMFSFWTSSDPTHGFVDYVSQSDAQSAGLISTDSNGVYIGVDYKNQAPNGRQSVRITSNKAYNAGTLVVLDLAHMPGGICATWPAFWTVGPNWPAGGEIDIIEGVHMQTTNDMTLHTADGCSISNTGLFSGSIGTDNCYVDAAGQSTNAGCQIDTPNTATYGSGFNANGGGVYAMEWTTEAISVYFFQRGSIPSDISSGSPNPSGWGTPVAQFSGSCDIPSFFSDNQLVFDNTFCGDWAGATWSTSGCASTQYPTCESFVQNNPSAFQNSYWQINSLQVFSETSGNDASTSSSAVSSYAAPIASATSQQVLTSIASATSQSTSTSTTSATSQSVLTSMGWSAPEASSTSSTSTQSSVTSQSVLTSVAWSASEAASTSAEAATSSASASATSSWHHHTHNHKAQKAVDHYTVTAASTTSTAAAPSTTGNITEFAEVEGGVIMENVETAPLSPTATGVSRRWSQRQHRREEVNDAELSQEWKRRLEGEKIRRMRAVRNVGSFNGRWKH